MRSLFARSLMAALTVGVLAVSHQAMAQTEGIDRTPVALFGNTGFGLTNLPMGGTIPSASGYSHPNLAQGFQVGEVPYFLESVDLGLVLPPSVITALTTPGSGYALDVTVFESTDNTDANAVPAPSDVKVATLTLSPTTTFVPNRKAMYKFVYLSADFSNEVRLEAGKTYWLVVSYTPQVSGALSFFWSFAAPSGTNLVPEQETPSDKTGVAPGFQYVNTLGQHDFGTDWIDHGPNSESFFNSGLRFTVNGYEAPVIIDGGGGGGEQTPPTLDCYALSKGFFKNNYPAGWPASVIANGGALIGTQVYTIDQLRTMLATNSTRGNQIGQLSSQLVAVYLSRALAIQTAGDQYLWWDGWAPESTEAQAAFDQAAALINASAGFETYRGRLRLTGCVTGVSPLISTLDAYILDNHCDDGDDDDDDDDDNDGHCRSKKERDKKRCNKGVRHERRSSHKSHECR
jgi:hypothetical protein